MFLSGNATQHIGTLTGGFQLTLNEGLSWTGGTIDATTTINLVSGSVSSITGGDAFTHWLLGTINNEGIVNEDRYIRYFAGVINNGAGAVWNFTGFGINGGGGMFGVPHDGTFNNAGSLVFTRDDANFMSPVQFNTTLNNSGTVTVQSGGSGFASVYVDQGSATGAFNVGSRAQLQFGHYGLATGATISGAGVTNINGTLDITGNASINTSLVNAGTLLVESGATLSLGSSFTQAPMSSSSPLATTRLSGGAIASSQTLGFANGILAGRGTINADLNLSGSLLNFQLGGTTPGGGANNYDSINVTGVTALGGGLGIFFKNGFETSISASNVFTVLTSKGGFTGSFDNAANGFRMDTADYLGTFLVNYKANGITLSNFVPSTRWLGGNGNWTDASHWLSNPMFPNDNGNTHYSALIRDGSVNLDTNINISRFFMTGGTLIGSNSLTVSNGLVWTNGNISGGGSFNLLAGSVSSISTPLDGTVGTRKKLIGTLNNFGTLNQTTDFGADIGQTFVNNMPGATWNIDSTRVGGVVTETNINNLGSITIRDLFADFGALTNSGSVILQSGSSLLLSNGGSDSGSFSLGAGSELVLDGISGVFTFNAGATVNGAGTVYLEKVTVAGNTIINSNVINNSLTVQPGVTLTLSGSFKQGDSFSSQFTTYLKNATLTSAQVLNFETGKLMGSGTINGNVSIGSNAPNMVIGSVVTPGDQANAIGTFTINGTFSLLNTARIVMDISGGATPTNDVLLLQVPHSSTEFLSCTYR